MGDQRSCTGEQCLHLMKLRLIFFKPYFLQHLFLRAGDHENSSSELSVLCLEIPDTEFGTTVGSFVNNAKCLNAIGVEKIFQYDLSLPAAVRAAFVVQGNFNHFVKIMR